MSGHQYITNSRNLFEDEDDLDEQFMRNSRPNTNPFLNSNLDEQRLTFQERKNIIEDRTVASTERSIGLLRDSEQIGIATAEELMRQREQLEQTDKRLDEINATLRFSQKHINGIKSVFSSLKNYMSGKNDQQLPKFNNTGGGGMSSARDEISPNDDLRSSIPEYDRYENHPTTRLRGVDEQVRPSGSRDMSARLEANLDEMCQNISRLKGLAEGLHTEIDSQNDLIDRITDKTETADHTIERQNKDIRRLLKK